MTRIFLFHLHEKEQEPRCYEEPEDRGPNDIDTPIDKDGCNRKNQGAKGAYPLIKETPAKEIEGD